MTFKPVCTVTGVLFSALFVVLLGFPAVIYWLFSMEATAAADLLARRAAMLFAGLGFIVLSIRDHPPSPTRKAVANGIAMAMAALAFLGLIEWIRGAVGPGIFVAIVTETMLALAMVRAR